MYEGSGDPVALLSPSCATSSMIAPRHDTQGRLSSLVALSLLRPSTAAGHSSLS